MPSPCQQKWYYDLAKADPDIKGLIWYVYSTSEQYQAYLDEHYFAVGVGKTVQETYAQESLAKHAEWGLEVLCSNQENNPFCADNGVSYKNPDYAKCLGKNVVKPGGSGNNLCNSSCGADSICDGKTPGTNNCDFNCKSVILVEICNNNDDDGDGIIDKGCDDDHDTFWDGNMICQGSYRAGNGVVYQCKSEWADLNDTNPNIGSEKCNNIDDDKDGVIDEGCDDDKDTFWDKAMICSGKYLAGNGVAYDCKSEWADLNDTNTKIGSEKCNNKDDDIDGRIDDGCDDDKDTFWDKDMTCNNTYLAGNNVTYQCKPEWSDCNDMDASIKHACPDLDGDGDVDVADLIIVITDFGKTTNLNNPKSDTNNDNIVDIYDVVYVASRIT
jgi:hypothetical protein